MTTDSQLKTSVQDQLRWEPTITSKDMGGHHLRCCRPVHGCCAVGWSAAGAESVETVRDLDALGVKLITVREDQIAKPEPSIERFEKELEKLDQEIETGAKLKGK